MPKILYQPIEHNNQKRILIKFDYDAALIKKLKEKTDAKWSATLKAWHITDTEINRIKCKLPIETIQTKIVEKKVVAIEIMQAKIAQKNIDLLKKLLQQLQLKAYSPSTVNTYTNEVRIFMQALGNVSAESLTIHDLKRYIQHCITKQQLSENTIHSRLNALKFLYEQVLGRDRFFIELPRPKKHLQLPKVLGEEELRRLFAALHNLKHKAILFIAYSAGLRVSEVINLRLQDIDRERQQLFVHCSKGKKDRYVMLSPLVLDVLEQYYKKSNIKPTNYLFEGPIKGQPYSIRSAQQIFSDARKKAGILKTLSFHSLRHSFATHLLEKGIDVIFIKDILGHFDLRTTERYLHVRRDVLINIESPLDALYVQKK
jgi:integrase/recombinase XerD